MKANRVHRVSAIECTRHPSAAARARRSLPAATYTAAAVPLPFCISFTRQPERDTPYEVLAWYLRFAVCADRARAATVHVIRMVCLCTAAGCAGGVMSESNRRHFSQHQEEQQSHARRCQLCVADSELACFYIAGAAHLDRCLCTSSVQSIFRVVVVACCGRRYGCDQSEQLQ